MCMVDIYSEKGEIGRAFAMITEGKTASQQAGFMIARVQNQITMARFYTYLGDFDKALAEQKSLDANTELKESPIGNYLGPIVHFLECYRCLEMGEVEKAVPYLDTVRQAAAELYYNPQLVKAAKQIEVLMAFKQGDYPQVLRLYEEVQVVPQGEVPMELSLSIMQARSLRTLGKNDAAYDLLQSARVYGEAQKIRLYLWEVYSELSQLEAERGAVDQAAAYRQQARDTINYVAEHCNDAQLGETFLNRPKVHAVMVQQ